MINVKDKRCEHPAGCNTLPRYGKPGHPTSRCAQHRLIGMITHSKSKCQQCSELAIYGTNYIPKRCLQHRHPLDSNLTEQKCVKCNLLAVLDQAGHCEYCNPEAFATARLWKQRQAFEYLDYVGLVGASTDRQLENGDCGAARPDRVYDENQSLLLIVEIDEDQHKGRQCLCEQSRMVNIGQTAGGVRVCFIRFNPDDYKTKKGYLHVDIQKRYEILEQLIRRILETSCSHGGGRREKLDIREDSLVQVFYLFYDGYTDILNEKWHSVVKFE